MIDIVRACIAAFIRLLTGVHTLDIGAFPDAPFVVIANHTSHIDTMLIWSVVPPVLRNTLRPVAGADYWMQGALRRWFLLRVLNGIAIDRTNVTRARNPLTPLLEALANGHSLLIFPEGTRTTTGELRPFRSGVYHLLKTMPVPILPIGLRNLQRVMPKGEVLPLPLICSLRVGAPIAITPDDSKETFLSRCEQAIRNLTSRDDHNA